MPDRDAIALDDPVGESLRGHHRHLARRVDQAAGYLPEVATFCTVTAAGPAGWADLRRLLGRGELADLFSLPATPPPDWDPVFALDGLQLVRPAGAGSCHPAADPQIVELGADDVPDMLRLVARTRPRPFWPRTHELGTYLGIRENGALAPGRSVPVRSRRA